MTILSTFFEFSLNSLSNGLKKHYKTIIKLGRKIVSKYKLSEKLLKKAVRDKIACKTHLE